MRKTICMLLAILTCFSFCTPSFAMEKVYLNAQESMVIDTYNEYDEIIKIRNMAAQEQKAIGVSSAQRVKICSDIGGIAFIGTPTSKTCPQGA